MFDKHCDMCGWYRADSEYMGRCTRYHEDHYPYDGEGCPGWEYWEDMPYDNSRNGEDD